MHADRVEAMLSAHDRGSVPLDRDAGKPPPRWLSVRHCGRTWQWFTPDADFRSTIPCLRLHIAGKRPLVPVESALPTMQQWSDC